MKGKVCGDFCEFTLDKGHFITGETMARITKIEAIKSFIEKRKHELLPMPEYLPDRMGSY
ncbi:hypothetical protein [Eubacterium segne]|uniref:hypothetical protein n=1 Tax=Eubacterium segne TaxID=2763045 RepID=UPI003F4FE71A